MLCPRCRQQMEAPVYRHGPIVLDWGRLEVLVEGERTPRLHMQVMMLLRLLMENSGRVVTRELVWHEICPDALPTSVNVIASRLRRALGRHGNLLRTIPTIGLVLDEEPVKQKRSPRADYYCEYQRRYRLRKAAVRSQDAHA